MNRLYGEDADLYDIAFDWDVSAEADWAAVYDGNLSERPRVGFDSEGGLLWHELVRR